MILLLLACTDSADVDAGSDPSREGPASDSGCTLRFDYELGNTVLLGDFDSDGRRGWLEGTLKDGRLSGAWGEHGADEGTWEGRLFEHPDYGPTVEGYGEAGSERVAFYGFEQPGGTSGWFAFAERSLEATWEEGVLSGAIEGRYRDDGVAWGELDDGRGFEGEWSAWDGALEWEGDVLVDEASDAWLHGEGQSSDTGWDSQAWVYPLWSCD